MYSFFVDLIAAPSGADQFIVSACVVLISILFLICIDIFVNSLFNFFRRKK